MPESAARLLSALVDIEDRAIEVARAGGCRCHRPVEGVDREYPYARFDRARSVGRPFDQIEWELIHEPGCPMDGQTGTG